MSPLTGSVAASDAPATSPSPGTREMVARLAHITEEARRTRNFYESDLNANVLREQWESTTDPGRKFPLQAYLSDQLLNSGATEEAIELLTDLKEKLSRESPRLLAQNGRHLDNRLSVAFLRLGEQQNCIHHHSTESCLLPIQGNGIHQHTEGSEKALEVLADMLEREPRQPLCMWLYNIAAMTLGRYPDNLDPRWRIPPKVFQSEYDIGRFPDVAVSLGIAVDDCSGGSVLDDFNGDDQLDLMVSSWRLGDQIHVFLNQGDGSFRDTTEQSGIVGITGGLNMVQADFDNDGDTDVLVLRGAWLQTAGNHPNSLLRNRGDGTFEDVTLEAGLYSLHPTQSATWFDYDNDGWLDLFIANESVKEARNECELYHNNHDGTFTDVAKSCGVNLVGFFKAVVSGDYDNDGRPDLFLSVLGGPNVLLHNLGPAPASTDAPGAWRFADVAASAGVAEPYLSFPAWFWDYDNDGWLDLYVADYNVERTVDIIAPYFGHKVTGEGARLYHNRGDGTFENVSDQAGIRIATLAMGCNYGDLDNDGWPDFYLGTGAPDLGLLFPNRMFRNNGGKTFQDVTTSGGFGHLQKGHGISFGDYDNDGDQDVFAVMGGAFPGDRFFNACFQNPGHGNHWIKLKLEGVESNRSAIGARIRVTTRQGGQSREIYSVVSSGGSFGCNPLTRHIGLGQAEEITQVEIRWPSGEIQFLKHPELDRLHHIREEHRLIGR